ncbi:hypothetical protein FV219_13390 [Methylobacterium sp. WL122]|nr:hypothetical protein FV219_13390 [Methylobacterium sp. WL122]
MLLAGSLDEREAHRLGAGIVAAIAEPYCIGEGVLAQVGVGVVRNEDASNEMGLAEMMLRADQALYAAKTSGKGRCILHGAAEMTLDRRPDGAAEPGSADRQKVRRGAVAAVEVEHVPAAALRVGAQVALQRVRVLAQPDRALLVEVGMVDAVVLGEAPEACVVEAQARA